MTVIDKPTKKYMDLIKRFPLRPIVDEQHLRMAGQVLSNLMVAYDDLSEEEKAYATVLGDVIHKYESVHYLMEKLTPVEFIQALMEANDLSQAEMSRIADSHAGQFSEVMNGKRELSKSQIIALANHFKVSTDAFMPRYIAKERHIDSVTERNSRSAKSSGS